MATRFCLDKKSTVGEFSRGLVAGFLNRGPELRSSRKVEVQARHERFFELSKDTDPGLFSYCFLDPLKISCVEQIPAAANRPLVLDQIIERDEKNVDIPVFRFDPAFPG